MRPNIYTNDSIEFLDSSMMLITSKETYFKYPGGTRLSSATIPAYIKTAEIRKNFI